MKILMVSMFSIHFFRWTEQLKNSGHEVYWIDVFDSNTKVEMIDFTNQIIGWRNKFKYPGRYKIKHEFPRLNNFVNKFNQRKLVDVFEEQLKIIKPDIVHSFVMFSACVPILKVMNKHKNIPWIFSAWGNDLYYLQNDPNHLKGMKIALKRINYMFADCKRDFKIAEKYNFKGEYLGTFPTGGGYEFDRYNSYSKQFEERKIILIKGYQSTFGRCNTVLKAILGLKKELSEFNIIVFGADPAVYEFIDSLEGVKKMPNLKIWGQLPHEQVLKLMGESLLYIGNSISDGMPNTLLEAIVMDVFPIQSNPGGATEEIIVNGENGLLIENPGNVEEIRNLIQKAISDKRFLKSGIEYNFKNIKPKLEREAVKKQVIEKYRLIEKNLKN